MTTTCVNLRFFLICVSTSDHIVPSLNLDISHTIYGNLYYICNHDVGCLLNFWKCRWISPSLSFPWIYLVKHQLKVIAVHVLPFILPVFREYLKRIGSVIWKFMTARLSKFLPDKSCGDFTHIWEMFHQSLNDSIILC